LIRCIMGATFKSRSFNNLFD